MAKTLLIVLHLGTFMMIKTSVKYVAAFLIVQAMLLGKIFAASAENAYVIVTCDTPGVTRIVVVDLNFHIVTKDVPMIFTANGTVTAKDGYELVSPKGGTYKDLPIGDAVSYAVKSTKAGEPGGSGSIILYKLDVEIDGIGEDKGGNGRSICL